MGQLTEWQERAWQNKLAKGLSTTNVEREFNFAYAELAEAYDAYRKQKPDLDEELADVILFTLSLAKMNGINLEQAVLKKMAKNEQRTYIKSNDGRMVRRHNKEES